MNKQFGIYYLRASLKKLFNLMAASFYLDDYLFTQEFSINFYHFCLS